MEQKHHHHHHHSSSDVRTKNLTSAQKRKLWKKRAYRAMVSLAILIVILCVLAHFFE